MNIPIEVVAIALSVLSIGIAALSLGWNIYRDVVLKPRVKVSVARVMLLSPTIERTPYLSISAVNFGPSSVRLSIVEFMDNPLWMRFFHKAKGGVIIHDYENPLSGQLPKTLEVGDTLTLLFPWNEENLMSRDPRHLGVSDSFGRTHWAPRADIKRARSAWEVDFSNGGS